MYRNRKEFNYPLLILIPYTHVSNMTHSEWQYDASWAQRVDINDNNITRLQSRWLYDTMGSALYMACVVLCSLDGMTIGKALIC